MTRKWTPEQRAKFKATMAAKLSMVKRSPREQPRVIYRMGKGGRLERLRLHTIKAYISD